MTRKKIREARSGIGGKYLLVIVAMCGLAASAVGICRSAVGVFYNAVTEDLGILKGTFTMYSTLAMLACAVVSLFIPQLLEKFAFKRLLVVGTVLAAGSTACMGLSRQIPLFYILGILRGVGEAMFAAVPITMVLNRWFKKGIGIATSIVFSFSGVSGAIFSPILSACITAFGWQVSYLVMALLILGLNSMAIFFPFQYCPEDQGLRPYGDNNLAVSVYTGSEGAKSGDGKYLSAASAAFFLFSISYTFVNMLTNIPQYYTVYVGEIGLDQSVGAMLLSCAMIGNVLSKLVLGFLNDRLGAVKSCGILLLVNAVSLVGIGTLPVFENLLIMGCASVLFGTSYALISVGVPLLTRHCFGVGNYGHLFPKVSFILNVGVSVSLTIIGYIYDYAGRFIFIIAAGILIDLLVLAATVFTAKLTAKVRREK